MIDDVAVVTATVTFAVLVILLAVPLWRLGAAFTQLECSIKELSGGAMITVKQEQDSLDQVNSQPKRVDSIASATNRSAEDVSALTTLVTAILDEPLIKVATSSCAVYKAMGLNQERQEKT